MSLLLQRLRTRQKRREKRLHRHQTASRDLSKYRTDPCSYAREELRVKWWDVQKQIAEALLKPPYRVAVQAAHSVGKTHLAAGLVNWWYDSHNPGSVITTAPTAEHVKNILWKEVRLQRKGRPGFSGPKTPELTDSPDHYAVGLTTAKGESFQGRHDASMLFIIDEAVGVDPAYFEIIRSMFKPEQGHAWLIIFNPTDTTSRAYQEVRSGRWNVIRMAAMDHPNIREQLAGRPAPIPSAVSLAQLLEAIEEECEPVHEGDERQPEDFEFPEGSGKWYRPGPVFQARWGGIWPAQGTYGVWSEALWSMAERRQDIAPNSRVAIGCDVARFGDDWTVIPVRIGSAAVHLEEHNGWDTAKTAARLKELCRQYGPPNGTLPHRVPVNIDDDGVGGGVIDQRKDGDVVYNFIPVNAGRLPLVPADYPNTRSELWFSATKQAKKGLMDLSRLPKDVREKLRTQAMSPEWHLDGAGRRVVESKDDTKLKLGCSPDHMDGLNLCYYHASGSAVMEVVEQPAPQRGRTVQQEARESGRAATAYGRIRRS